MPRTNDRHVVPNPGGGWSIKTPGEPRSYGNYDTQDEAAAVARKIIGEAGGGELVIHRTDLLTRAQDRVPA